MTDTYMQYSDADTGLVARWTGGEYISLGYIDSDSEFHAHNVINVWDYDKSAAQIPFTCEAMEREVKEHIAQAEREEWLNENSLLWESEARALGSAHAEDAAECVTDSDLPLRKLLDLMTDADLRADEYMPRRPDLSGEFADGLTPRSLFEEITGQEWSDDDDSVFLDDLASAYEDGVSEVFEDECIANLKASIAAETETTN